jgi:S1-C subfamily serine protease
VISIEGKPIASNDDVVRVVRRHRLGESLRVVVVRGRNHKNFEVTLGDLPSA